MNKTTVYTDDQISSYMDHLRKMGKYNEDQIQAYKKHLEDNYGTNRFGASAEKPQEIDLYGGQPKERLKSGFSDPKSAAQALLKMGYKNPAYNKEGQLVAQDAVGRWVTDESNFFPKKFDSVESAIQSAHPGRWLLANTGAAFPTLGQMLGGGLSGVAGLAMTGGNPAAGLATGTIGSGAGATAGEWARQKIGESLGMYDPNAGYSAPQMLQEGAMGMAGEFGGRAIGKIPLPKFIARNVDEAVAKVAAVPSWLMMGGAVPYQDVARNIFRPSEVQQTGARGFGLRAARKMEDELNDRARLENSLVGDARKQFFNTHQSTPVNTTPAISLGNDIIERNIPNSSARSALSPAEQNELRSIVKSDLTTTIPGDVASGTPQQMFPEKTAGELMRTADYLDHEINRANRSILPSDTSTAMNRANKGLLGRIKALLHNLDPNYAKADKRFAQYAEKARTLKPIEGENQESVVNSLWGKNNTARQEAAHELTPQVYNNELLDLKSAQAYDRAGAMGATDKEVAARTGLGLLLGSGVQSASHSPAEAIAAAAAFLAATSPKAHYWGGKAVGSRALPTSSYLLTPDFLSNGPWSRNRTDKEPQQ